MSTMKVSTMPRGARGVNRTCEPSSACATLSASMYRSMICGHCRMEAATAECRICGLWICPACLERGCDQTQAAWTGECRTCHIPYPDEQRRDVLERGDGQVTCRRCGSSFRLRRLELLESRAVVSSLLAELLPCDRCGRRFDAEQRQLLLVLHDRWRTRSRCQTIFHLLCSCGRTLASAVA